MQNSHNNTDPIIHNHRVMHQSGRYLGSNWYDLMRIDGRCDGRVTIAGVQTLSIAGLPSWIQWDVFRQGCSVMKRGGTPRF